MMNKFFLSGLTLFFLVACEAYDSTYVPYKGKFTLLDKPSETELVVEEKAAVEVMPVELPVEEKKMEAAQETCREHYIFLEEKSAYFSPVNHKMKKIFGKGMGLYGFELTFPTWRFIYGWVGGSYLTKVGHSIGGHNRTRVTLVPLSLGVKFIYTIQYIDLYAGIGGLGTYFHTVDHSPFVTKSASKWGAGGTAKLGFFIRPSEKFFIDFFGDYSYMKFHFHGGKKTVRHDVNFSGWSVGGGLGWPF